MLQLQFYTSTLFDILDFQEMKVKIVLTGMTPKLLNLECDGLTVHTPELDYFDWKIMWKLVALYHFLQTKLCTIFTNKTKYIKLHLTQLTMHLTFSKVILISSMR